MPKLSKNEWQSLKEDLNLELNKDKMTFEEDEEIYISLTETRISSIMEALCLVDPKNKKAENQYPGEIPGQEGSVTVEYFTIYEPTISGDNRKLLVDRLMKLLLSDIGDDKV